MNDKHYLMDITLTLWFYLFISNKGDSEESVQSERDLAMGWALNTFLRNVGVFKHNSSMDRVQSFITKDKRLLKIGQQKKKVSIYKSYFKVFQQIKW